MNVCVRLFGPAAEWAGEAQATLDIAPGTTLGGLAGEIARRWPRVGNAPGMRLALNRQFVALDRIVAEGDEVAVIPPVSGG